MNSIRLTAIVLLAIFLNGCGSANHPAPLAPQPPQQPQASATPASQPSPGDAGFNSPDALARKTADYSRQMQSILSEKQGGSAPLSPATQPSAPPSLSLAPNVTATPAKTDSSTAPPPAPQSSQPKAADHAGSANTAIALTPVNPALPAPAVAEDSAGLSAKVSQRVTENTRDVAAHLDFQLFKLLMDDRVPDLETLATLPTEDRELISSLIDGLVNFRNGLREDNNMLLSRKIQPLLDMSDRLRSQADLTIANLALCTAVRTYGEYDPIDPPRFAAGADHEAILYCEIENFSSQLDPQKLWQTKLTQETSIFTENGTEVWSDQSSTITDTARRRRHDFFIVKRLHIPANLGVGRYLVKVSVVDQQVSRVAEATLPIVIAVQ